MEQCGNILLDEIKHENHGFQLESCFKKFNLIIRRPKSQETLKRLLSIKLMPLSSELSRVSRVIAGKSGIFGWIFGSNSGDLPIHVHNEENTYFSVLRLFTVLQRSGST